MPWYTYEISPIDTGWERQATVWETAELLGAEAAKMRAQGESDPAAASPDLEDFLAAWEQAKIAAARAGWEGDFRIPPTVFWVPDDCMFSFGFVVKQDNNGTTYIVSPVEMPHLEALS